MALPAGGQPGRPSLQASSLPSTLASRPRLTVSPPQVRNTAIPKLDPMKAEGGWKAALTDAGSFFSANVLGSHTAQVIFQWGFNAAMFVMGLNPIAGVIAIIFVLLVATFADIIVSFTDMNKDDHVIGQINYDNAWHDVYAEVIHSISALSLKQGAVVDTRIQHLAATSYADGYMQQFNYLSAWRAFCGGVYGGQSAYSADGSGAERAWRAGMYAGDGVPAPSDEAWQFFLTKNPGANYEDFYYTCFRECSWGPCLSSRTAPGLWGGRMMFIFPPYETSLDLIADGDDKRIRDDWHNAGYYTANGASFLWCMQQDVAQFQTPLSHATWYRDRGFFQGAVIGPPDVPAGVGVRLGNIECYTPDNRKLIFKV